MYNSKAYWTLSYFTFCGYWMYPFASLLGIPKGIRSSAIGVKIRPIAAGIKRYRSIIKKKKNKHDEIVLLAKFKLNIIEVLFSMALIDSNISDDKFVLNKQCAKII